MKGKQLLTLVAALLVLGAAGLFLRQKESSRLATSKVGMGGKLLGDLDVNAIASFRVQSGTNQLVVAREGDAWVVKQRGNYPAGFNTLAEFLRKLADLKVTRPVEAGPSRLPALDLVEPSQGKGIRLDLVDASGKTLRSILLGKSYMKGGEDNSPFGGGFASGRYVMVGGDNKTVALVSDALSNVDVRPEDWLDKEFLKVEQPRRIEIVRPAATNNFTLVRTNDTAEWLLADAKGDEKADPGKTSLFSSVLASPTFNDVVVSPDLAALGLEKPEVARITTASGFVYEIKIGKPQANEDRPVQVFVTAALESQRVVGKDEKPEDKEKLDKAFKEELSKKEAKLKSEQALSKWTYLVSKWSIDALLKNRGDLFPDKKAPDAAPGANGAAPALPGLPDFKLPGN
jgi:hypothetical protein